jgi:prefoldin subunit 5
MEISLIPHELNDYIQQLENQIDSLTSDMDVMNGVIAALEEQLSKKNRTISLMGALLETFVDITKGGKV